MLLTGKEYDHITDNDKDHGADESREVRFHSGYTTISINFMRNFGSSVEVW